MPSLPDAVIELPPDEAQNLCKGCTHLWRRTVQTWPPIDVCLIDNSKIPAPIELCNKFEKRER